MKTGFTLIEIVVFLAIASAMSIILFQSYFQTNRIVQFAGSMIDSDRRIMIMQDRLEKDITGAFIPQYLKQQKEEVEEEKTIQKKLPEKQRPLPKLFYSVNVGNRLKELTFITSNPLPVYGAAKPRIVRVRYQLVADERHKGAFTLLRQEAKELDYGHIIDKEKGPRAYEIADNIKTLTLNYVSPGEKNDEEQPSLKQAKEWNSDTQFKSEQKKKKRLLPQYVDMNIVLFDTTGKKTIRYESRLPIYADPYLQEKNTDQQQKKSNQSVRVQLADWAPNMEKFIQKYRQGKLAQAGGKKA